MIQKKTVGNTYTIILEILLQITNTNQSEIKWVHKLNMKVLLIVANHNWKNITPIYGSGMNTKKIITITFIILKRTDNRTSVKLSHLHIDRKYKHF